MKFKNISFFLSLLLGTLATASQPDYKTPGSENHKILVKLLDATIEVDQKTLYSFEYLEGLCEGFGSLQEFLSNALPTPISEQNQFLSITKDHKLQLNCTEGIFRFLLKYIAFNGVCDEQMNEFVQNLNCCHFERLVETVQYLHLKNEFLFDTQESGKLESVFKALLEKDSFKKAYRENNLFLHTALQRLENMNCNKVVEKYPMGTSLQLTEKQLGKCSISGDGRYYMTFKKLSPEGTVTSVYETATDTLLFKFETALKTKEFYPWEVPFGPQSNYCIAGQSIVGVPIVNLGNKEWFFPHLGDLTPIADHNVHFSATWSPTDRYLAVIKIISHIDLYDLKQATSELILITNTSKTSQFFNPQNMKIGIIVFDNQETIIALHVFDRITKTYSILMLSPQDLTMLRSIPATEFFQFNFTFSYKGELLAICDGTTRILNHATNEVIFELKDGVNPHPFDPNRAYRSTSSHVVFSHDDNLCAIGLSYENIVLIIDIRTRKIIKHILVPPNNDQFGPYDTRINSMMFNLHNNYLTVETTKNRSLNKDIHLSLINADTGTIIDTARYQEKNLYNSCFKITNFKDCKIILITTNGLLTVKTPPCSILPVAARYLLASLKDCKEQKIKGATLACFTQLPAEYQNLFTTQRASAPLTHTKLAITDRSRKPEKKSVTQKLLSLLSFKTSQQPEDFNPCPSGLHNRKTDACGCTYDDLD